MGEKFFTDSLGFVVGFDYSSMLFTVKGDETYLQIRSPSERDRNRLGRNSIGAESRGFLGSCDISEAGQQRDEAGLTSS